MNNWGNKQGGSEKLNRVRENPSVLRHLNIVTFENLVLQQQCFYIYYGDGSVKFFSIFLSQCFYYILKYCHLSIRESWYGIQDRHVFCFLKFVVRNVNKPKDLNTKFESITMQLSGNVGNATWLQRSTRFPLQKI